MQGSAEKDECITHGTELVNLGAVVSVELLTDASKRYGRAMERKGGVDLWKRGVEMPKHVLHIFCSMRV